MNNLQSLLTTIDNFVWGPPLLILLVGTGVYFTFRLGLLQFRYLPKALTMLFSKHDSSKQGDVSSFAALCTALSATIGTGNIVGVATAIKLGEPWCFILDVASGSFWYGHQIRRVSPCG